MHTLFYTWLYGSLKYSGVDMWERQIMTLSLREWLILATNT